MLNNLFGVYRKKYANINCRKLVELPIQFSKGCRPDHLTVYCVITHLRMQTKYIFNKVKTRYVLFGKDSSLINITCLILQKYSFTTPIRTRAQIVHITLLGTRSCTVHWQTHC